MKSEISILNNKLTDSCSQVEELKAENLSLAKKIATLSNSLDDEDAYVRRETVIFNGSAIPSATTGEICNNIIRKVIKDKLNIELNESDISVAHRAGKKINFSRSRPSWYTSSILPSGY